MNPNGRKSFCRKPFSGFTLVELLVVIAIIGILIALLLPAVQSAREAAHRLQCSNQLRQISLAIHNYESTHRVFPPSSVAHGATMSYVALVLPFMEQQALHKTIDFTKSWGPTDNPSTWNTALPPIKCPSAPESQEMSTGLPGFYEVSSSPAANHYVAVSGAKSACPAAAGSPHAIYGDCTREGGITTNGVMYPASATTTSGISDGLSNTFLLGETHIPLRPWIAGCAGQWHYGGRNLERTINAPQSGTYNNDKPLGSFHPGGCHMSMADASVHFVSDSISLGVFHDLATRGGMEVTQLP